MLILEALLDLKSKQGDATAAFYMQILKKVRRSTSGCPKDSRRKVRY